MNSFLRFFFVSMELIYKSEKNMEDTQHLLPNVEQQFGALAVLFDRFKI